MVHPTDQHTFLGVAGYCLGVAGYCLGVAGYCLGVAGYGGLQASGYKLFLLPRELPWCNFDL